MSCTIDHLRVGHRVTVLRDFADLAGVAFRAGEDGIVRDLGLDTARMEIRIELERDNVRVPLRFALRASDGPRNGHMREFFDLGDPVPDEAETARRKAMEAARAQPEPAIRRPEFSLEEFGRSQPPDGTCIEELTVACECDPAFHRALPHHGELSLHACLCCGALTCARSFGDDGRFTGDSWQAYRTVALGRPSHDWLARWPRIKPDYAGANVRWPMAADLVRYPTLYYPADTRCADLAQLAELEMRLAREQSAMSVGECLRATQCVTAPPPADLPREFLGFADLWSALQLTPGSDLAELMRLAQPGRLSSSVAVDLLRQCEDAFGISVSALRSGDWARQSAGFAIARDLRPVDPRLAGILIEILRALPLTPLRDVPSRVVSWARFEMIFLLIAELKLATPEMLATLRTLMRQLVRHDVSLVDCVRVVIRELDPPTIPVDPTESCP